MCLSIIQTNTSRETVKTWLSLLCRVWQCSCVSVWSQKTMYFSRTCNERRPNLPADICQTLNRVFYQWKKKFFDKNEMKITKSFVTWRTLTRLWGWTQAQNMHNKTFRNRTMFFGDTWKRWQDFFLFLNATKKKTVHGMFWCIYRPMLCTELILYNSKPLW